MKKIFAFLLVFGFLFGPNALAHDGVLHANTAIIGSTYAQEGNFVTQEDLPSPGLTPDNTFYFTDKWTESVRTFFTFGKEAKARRLAALANERLSEANAMLKKDKPKELESATRDYSKLMAKIQKRVSDLKDSVSVQERVANATGIHQVVLEHVLQNAPEQARTSLETALARAEEHHEQTIQRLAELNEKRAGAVEAVIMKKRVLEFQQLANDEAATEESVREAASKFDKQQDIINKLEKDRAGFKAQFAENFASALPAVVETEVIERSDFSQNTKDIVSARMRALAAKHDEQLRAVAKEDAVSAAKAFDSTLQELSDRLETDGAIKETVRERILKKIEDFDKTGDAISQDTQGKSEAARDAALDKIREARERNIEVLERVHTNVPEKAGSTIERVIERRRETFEKFEERFPRPASAPAGTQNGTMEEKDMMREGMMEEDKMMNSAKTEGTMDTVGMKEIMGIKDSATVQDTKITESIKPAVETSTATQEPAGERTPATVLLSVTANDADWRSASPLRARKGDKVKLTFNVAKDGVYYGGLQFKGSKFDTGAIHPGASGTVEFTADESFEFTAFWPQSSIKKWSAKFAVE